MILATAVLTKVAEWFSAAHKIVPRPSTIYLIHLLLVALLILIATSIYLAHRPRNVYLVDYTCFRPSSNFRFPKATSVEHARLSPLLDDSTANFIASIHERSGMGDQTYFPPVVMHMEPYCALAEARTEAELVVFSVIDDLLAKTCINLDGVGVLITNCSLFCPVPSIADMIVNRYKLRGDLRVMNLSGMACSASVTAVGLASNTLQFMPWGSYALVVSTEIIGPCYYVGNNRSMQLSNILFRMGGVAKLLSTSRSKARFRLGHFTRTNTAASNIAYKCVYQEEDEKGNIGVALSKDLMAVARDALINNITATAPLVLPPSELFKFWLFCMAKKVLHWRKIRPHIPNFCAAFDHFCIHVGGPAVITSVQHGLSLSDKHVEPSRMTLHRFGNQSTSSIWYELAYIEAKGRMKKGNRVWMIGFGAGYECNTVGWMCIQPSSCEDGPWADYIDRYPVDLSNKV
ncbi:3-ketoacyl-CoA synthase 4-like [Hordeum vulgare subsp. vulgare]|uniref:3-ketoacyl-CoA synthase n=1 Tax=Hordeum vulgare subsp. vulgare TaxID=112509 RepID=A0A8I6XHM6_HORVV|nr:3-ketoacyl-CoA synthase 4-like [Hordeum vulgare subsp. vulgare]